MSEPLVTEAQIKRRRGVSIVWLIPIVAGLVAAFLGYKAITDKGPTITISFQTAEGLEAGKTAIKFKDVTVGTAEHITIADDLQSIVVTAQMVPGSDRYLQKDSRFWVVRPRIGTSGVSGLGTLFSGAYIALEPGTGESGRDFVGLEQPPEISYDQPGTRFRLRADTLGSLSQGAPVYDRGIQVGQVVDYALDPDGRGIVADIYIFAPHDKRVLESSRFWNVSGVNVSLGAGGADVQVASIQSLIMGGIEFDTPGTGLKEAAAAPNTEFTLFDTKQKAEAAQFTRKVPFFVLTDASVRGLKVGAPVQFRGITIGEVSDFRLVSDGALNTLKTQITIELEVGRILIFNEKTGEQHASAKTPAEALERFDNVVKEGLRAELATGNLLTGDLYVALDFHPDAPPADLKRTEPYPTIPSIPNQFDAWSSSLTGILQKMAALPIDELGKELKDLVASIDAIVASPNTSNAVANLNDTLAKLNNLIGKVDKQATPILDGATGAVVGLNATLKDARSTLTGINQVIGPNSATAANLDDLMKELTRSARSLRVLTDYLERHPDALIRGKGASSR